MVGIIDYKMGNVASVKKAFDKIGAKNMLSNNAEEILNASHLVLPGVGAFGDGMENLRNLNLIDLLNDAVITQRKPFLGICLGMQLIAEKGYEFGINKGFGWIKGEAVKLDTSGNLRLPHIGWDNIEIKNNSLLFKNIPNNSDFYFVHSFHLKCNDASIITSICDYGKKFAASIQKDNIFAVQFHPEKSQEKGLQILKNFIEYA